MAATARRAEGALHARAIALDDGTRRIAIAVVDSLMMPREFLDRVKETASKATGIPPERMLISATHSHSAPALMGALGTDANPEYAAFVEPLIVKAIEGAVQNLEPAEAGWTVVDDPEHTHCRRWILRPDRMRADPFGGLTVRAQMHPGYQNPDFIGPAGPVDPGFTLLAFRTPSGRPIALLANYSMHYVGATGGVVSPDYYGPFVENVQRLIGTGDGGRPFVAMMSQGTSGDQHWMDYGRPKKDMNIPIFAGAMAALAHRAYQKIQFRGGISIAMAERKLRFARRMPGPERLAWAMQVVGEMKGASPKNQPEVYAREQMYLADEPERELKLQAVRIGELGIAAIPDEVFALTGLKIKAQSPLAPTFNIELANGAEGYIPPPEQHKLGGYTTWPARTAALEPAAEPKIVDAVLGLLEEVSGKHVRPITPAHGTYAKAILASKPLAYWRMNEWSGPTALDATRHGVQATYGDGIAFYLEGPAGAAFSGDQMNRAPHFAGGRMAANVEGIRGHYSVALWFYNGLPADARPVTGYLVARGPDELAIGGAGAASGKLVFSSEGHTLAGSTPLALNTWYHLVLVRERAAVRVYLNGNPTPEIAGEAGEPATEPGVMIGGHGDTTASFEGRIDEVAVFGRALPAAEAAAQYKAAAGPAR